MTLSLLSQFLTIGVAHAQLDLPPVIATASGNTLLAFICVTVFRWVFTAAIVLSIALIMIAAFRYVTSAGEPAKIQKANQTLIFVAIGIAVAILARSLPILVGSLVSKDLNLDPCTAQTAPTNPGTTPGTTPNPTP